MNLDSINTVQDLISENETMGEVEEIVNRVLEEDKSKADSIVETVLNEGIQVGHEVVLRLVGAAIQYHQHNLSLKMDEEEIDQCVLWTRDLTLLQSVMESLKQLDI